MFKRILNRSKDYLAAISFVEQQWINQLKGKVSCLLYHRIENYAEHDFLDKGGSPVTSPGDFDKELSYLKTLPTRFYTLEDLSSGQFPDSETIGIVICFDDCFKCNYQQGLEILSKHSIPAVFFQCSGFINSRSLIWEHQLYWLFSNTGYKQTFTEKIRAQLNDLGLPDNELLNYLREQVDPKIIEQAASDLIIELSLQDVTKDIAESIYPNSKDVIEAFSRGHEMASHGHHHYKRETITDTLFEQELLSSQTILKNLIGSEPVSFSYPFNSFFPTDHNVVNKYFKNIATVNNQRLSKPLQTDTKIVPRLTWPGRSNNSYRMKRWLLTGSF